MEKKFQKYNGRVVLRVDVMKDDSGNYAVSTEQGASVSHMTLQKSSTFLQAFLSVLDKQVPEEACPKMWIRIPKARRPKRWDPIDDPVVPLERNLYGHSLVLDSFGKENSRKFCLKKDGRKSPDGSAYTFIAKCNCSCQCMLTTKRWQGQTQNMPKM